MDAARSQLRSYRELEVWQMAMELVIDCYRIAGRFPKHETHGLADQLRRVAVSIPANIAEGQARWHSREFLRFLSIATGSLAELETHLEIAARLEYANKEGFAGVMTKAARVNRMLHGLKKALSQKVSTNH